MCPTLGVFHLGIVGGLLSVLAFAIWIIAIVDIIKRKFENAAIKICWLLCVIFLHIAGAVIYFIFGRPMGRLPYQG